MLTAYGKKKKLELHLLREMLSIVFATVTRLVGCLADLFCLDSFAERLFHVQKRVTANLRRQFVGLRP